MTDEVFTDLVALEGEVPVWRDARARSTSRPSKELRDWCYDVTNSAHSIDQRSSKKSIAESIASTKPAKLKRKCAVRPKAMMGSQSSSLSGKSQQCGLDLWEEAGMDSSVARRYSFDADAREEVVLVFLDTSISPKASRVCLPVFQATNYPSTEGYPGSLPQQESVPRPAGQDQVRPALLRTFTQMGL
ncbi:hypothetical protein K458DRAFT_423131 [Lentithecium fluviatile CBS 122367]|uniref:Uncharacterized protein n=1 Tax=Lentithecium fluviatile CBS 122367 TaxID=1168545 RepID=A0A6G1IKB7_9PLEO|nr:hypothetical protein K458DRAFT_423131 [Lentithecium fluviatile CBS 122367]